MNATVVPTRGPKPIDPALPRHESIVHALIDAARRAPDRTALICRDRSITYDQYARAAAGLARKLAPLGVAGSRGVVLMGNSIEHAVAFMGIMGARGQKSSMNPNYTERELVPMLKDADPAVIVCDQTTAGKAQSAARAAGVKHVVEFDTLDFSSPDWPGPLPTADDWATLPYTGGTTGRSKGASTRHRAVTDGFFRVTLGMWPMGFDTNVYLNVAPMFHIWGFQMATWIPVYTRCPLVIVPQYKPDDVLEQLERHKVTVFLGGPAAIYNGLLAAERFPKTDLSALKLCFSGGSACAEDLLKRWKQATGCTLIEGYGMSEGAPISGNPITGLQKLRSVGPAGPGTEIDIVDADTGTKHMPRGQAGEIRLRGPQFMDGYRNRPEDNAQALRDGWLYTGDIGYLDEDDYLFIVDRKKELINVGGQKVYPRELDELLFSHPAVREAATVGVPDQFLGEAVKVVVALRDGAKLTADELLAYCRTNLVKYKWPKHIAFVDALPKTGAGKIDKLKLRGLRE